jgi:hypothetical protein
VQKLQLLLLFLSLFVLNRAAHLDVLKVFDSFSDFIQYFGDLGDLLLDHSALAFGLFGRGLRIFQYLLVLNDLERNG